MLLLFVSLTSHIRINIHVGRHSLFESRIRAAARLTRNRISCPLSNVSHRWQRQPQWRSNKRNKQRQPASPQSHPDLRWIDGEQQNDYASYIQRHASAYYNVIFIMQCSYGVPHRQIVAVLALRIEYCVWMRIYSPPLTRNKLAHLLYFAFFFCSLADAAAALAIIWYPLLLLSLLLLPTGMRNELISRHNEAESTNSYSQTNDCIQYASLRNDGAEIWEHRTCACTLLYLSISFVKLFDTCLTEG